MLVFLQVGQRQIFKQQIQIFIFGNLKNKFIFPFAVLAGIALTAAAPSRPGGRSMRSFCTKWSLPVCTRWRMPPRP